MTPQQISTYFYKLSLAKKAALLSAALVTIACTVIVLASYQGSKQLVDSSAKLLGDSLIQQLSRDASNPLVQGDKLSLQALLNSLVRSPMIIHGGIYDLENRSMAEAGRAQDGLSMSASITFQDSIAGYAVITLNTPSLESDARWLAWQLVGLTVLLAILIFYLSAFPARYICALLDDLSVVAARPQTSNNLHIAYRGEDELQRLAQQILRGPDKFFPATPLYCSEQAVLSLELRNYAQLQQELGEVAVRKKVMACYQQLMIVCKLYEGQIEINEAARFTLVFIPTDDEDSYPFRALCSAYLFQQWALRHHSPISFDIGIVLKDQSATSELEGELLVCEVIEQARLAGRSGLGELVISRALSEHCSVNHRVRVRDCNEFDSVRVLEKFKEPYQQLLKCQLDTLAAQSKA
ncbi:MAG: hypothetical protein JKY66_10035 [Spongiibacteraceae bacterium]|nr:hypothetical protein [Spongiibacteraceae bacterium]